MNKPQSPTTLPPTTKKQLNKEAKWSFGLTIVYMFGWIISAYFSPNGFGVFGLPLWFEMSCFYLPVVFIVVSSLILKGIYQDISLESHDNTNNTLMEHNQNNINKDTP